MTSSQSPAPEYQPMGPVSSTDRIEALDITRGVAVLAILLMNIWSFGWPKEIFDYPPLLSHLDGAAVATWAFVHSLFEGSQRTVFSILFGAGALMILGRLQQKNTSAHVKRIYVRRSFLLIVFGLVDAYIFMWPADILYVYGLCAFVLLPMRHMKIRSLVMVTILLLCIPTAIRIMEYQDTLQAKQAHEAARHQAASGNQGQKPVAEGITDWQKRLKEARPNFQDKAIQESITIMQQGSLFQVFKKQAVGSLVLQTVVTVKWWFVDALLAMIIGMILFRAGILTLQAPKAAYRRLLFIGYGIGLPLSIWETATLINSDFDPLQQAIVAFSYDIGRIAMAMGHLAVILLFCRVKGFRAIKEPLAAVGRMALSNYLGQSILCGIIFYSFGFGLYGQLAGYWLYFVVLAVWIIEIIWSVAWLKRYKFGPFEWVWRSLTYGRRQAMR